MTGHLYFNTSPRNKLNKTITNASSSLTIRYKENTSITNPDIMISSSVDIDKYNYIYIGGEIGRYYYIESYEMSQQYYILHCKVDVLMSYKSDISNTSFIAAKNSNVYNLYLNDDRMKLYSKTRTLTFPFKNGFRKEGSKVFSFLLTINGGGTN